MKHTHLTQENIGELNTHNYVKNIMTSPLINEKTNPTIQMCMKYKLDDKYFEQTYINSSFPKAENIKTSSLGASRTNEKQLLKAWHWMLERP
ncbi:MAG: hypothetical protein H0T62_03845 [Parachlamydiaceae bacterium]|nr:hypothetical protein [Parachlamydiaceae bacterium]